MEEYTPIQPFEVLSERLGMPASQIVKLDANENPYGPVPAVAEALAEYPYYHIYPDPQQSELRDGLSRVCRRAGREHPAQPRRRRTAGLPLPPLPAARDAIINCPPTFGMYSFDAGLVGAPGHRRVASRRLQRRCRGD